MREKKAVFIKDVSGNMSGHAELFKVTPAHDGHKYIVVSAVRSMYAHETYIFGADKEGNIIDWGELNGSYRDDTDIDKALSYAGYVRA